MESKSAAVLYFAGRNMESKSTEGKIDQNRWVIQIREYLEYVEKEKTLELCSVSVFNAPKELLAMKPEAYTPQAVSIGPHHHRKSELCETERYKVAAARRTQKKLNGGLKFESVVEEFSKLDWKIRSCYQKYVVYDRETLAWLMALDASFVLECLQCYVDIQKLEGEFLKRRLPAFDPKGRSVAHNAIVRDMMMLENQIPLFLLEKLLEMQFDSKHKAEECLCIFANQACRELSPFRFALPKISTSNFKQRAHILELLHYVLTSTSWELDEIVAEGNEPTPRLETETATLEAKSFKRDLSSLRTAFSSLNIGPVRHLLRLCQRILQAKPVQLLMKLPWRTLRSLLNSAILPLCKGWLRSISNFIDNSKAEAASSSTEWVIPPSRDELAVPSVSELVYAGVKFAPTEGDLSTIRFHEKKAILYLPPVRLDTNTEVIFRNLIAFEASAAPGAFVFTRYIDFVNGMVDTEEDVRLLRKSGIIYSHLDNDQETANLWNSMGKCARPSRVQYIDKVVAHLNKYYRSRWNVAVAEYANKYIYRSWKFLSLFATILLLLVSCLQAFCSVCECKKGILINQLE